MKKRFIFFAMMLLTLIGGANVLKAQEDVVTINGNATSYNHYYPIAFNSSYGLSQVIYNSTEINHISGQIDKIAFKVDVTRTRNLSIYLQNTTDEILTGWKSFDANDMVYSGELVITPTDGWFTIDVSDFEYSGANILLTVADNTGSAIYTYNNGCAYIGNAGRSCLVYKYNSSPVSTSDTPSTSTRQPSIRFTFAEAQDDLEPAVPTNLVAEAVNHTSIQLTWDAAVNAMSYNVYKNGTLVGPASTTSYLVEGLDANTGYCFTVTGVRGAKESAASEQVCATTAKALLIKEVLVGAGEEKHACIPTHTYYKYTTSQQIYTADELGFGAGNVLKIAFNNTTNAQYTRNIDVYITNTTKANFTGSYDMVNMTAEDKFYSGSYTFKQGWNEIELSKNFEYNGGNILICVDDNTGSYPGQLEFAVNNTSEARATYYCYDYANYDPLNVAGKYTNGSINQNNQIKFFVEAEPGVTPNVESINFAEVIRLGNYWSEKYTAPSAEVKVENIGADITSIESSNDFFVLSENIDLTASNIVFNVTCKTETSYAGTQNGNIVISYEIEGEASTVEIPVTATAYAPAQADVIELATDVTFAEGTYTNTPDFATLHDDYILPGEATEGSTPDAVYHFTMENEGILTVNVTGTNAIAAVYKAEDIDLESEVGPSSNNNYEGEVVEVAMEMDIVIGEENTIQNGYLPSNEYYNYSVSQQIYTASEINASKGIIKSIAFRQRGTVIGTRNLAVYMLNTDETAFADNRSWVALSSENLVFSGNVTYPAVDAEWCQIDLQTPFEYNGTNILLCVVDNTGTYSSDITFDTYETTEQRAIYVYSDNASYNVANLSVYSGNTTVNYQNVVNTVKFHGEFVADAKSMAKSRSTEPQINAVQYPAGEYYLVAAAEDAFSVTIETATLPAPEAVTYTAPENGAIEQNNPKLSWTFGKYTSEYQVLLGTTNPPTDVVVDWTSELAISFQTEALANQTTYYWQVNAKNATGTTAGEVYSFITPLNQATELEVTDAELYPGETTTLTWTAAEDALSYNVYLNDTVKLNETAIEETSFELTNLPHNVNPGNAITVTAVHTLGESAHSEAIYVKMAGEFNLVVNVKDAEGNAIENAAVAFITKSDYDAYYDEYNQLVPAIDTLYTDAEGKITQTLAMPCVYSYPDGIYSYLEVVISKEYATSQSFGISAYTEGLSAGQDYVKNITLEYIAPQNVKTDKDEYVEGENMVFTWNKVEGAVGYNVYKVGYSDEIEDYVYTLVNEEAITDTTFTVENLKYDLESLYVTYAVTADYGFVESAKNAKVYPGVTGKGQIAVTVTDGTNPIKGATVTLVGPDGFNHTQTYTFVTNEEGKITGDMLIGSYYTATVSHYDYNEKVMEEDVAIEYQTELSLDIVLEAKHEVEFEVTAAESGDYVNVKWEAAEGATSYNVYRRDSEGNVKRIDSVTSLTATDYYWSTLEAGTYEYGVSAIIEVNNTESFENSIPDTWISGTTSQYGNANGWQHSKSQGIDGTDCIYTNTGGASSYSQHYYIVSPQIDLSGIENPKLTFQFKLTALYPSYGKSKMEVKVISDLDDINSVTNLDNVVSKWTSENDDYSTWKNVEIDLSNYSGNVYVVFTQKYIYFSYLYIDDVVFPSNKNASGESKINWSNEVVREAYATFNNAAGDNDWSNEANWSTEAVPAEGENVIIAANANLNTVANVAKIRINGTATLTLNDGAELTVTDTITQLSDSYYGTNGKLVINDGAQLFQSNEKIYATFNMNIVNPSSWSDSNTDGWQFIASPFNAAQVSLFTGSFMPKSYDLYKYEGNAESGLEWNNQKNDDSFEEAFVNGRGYLASYETLTTATLSGNLYNKDNFKFTEVSYTEGKELANLHLLGNPFSFDMDWSRATFTDLVDGIAVVTSQGGWDYTQTTIPVGDGFFVQATGADASLSYDHKDVVPATRGSEKANSINVIASGKAGKDNVVVNFAGQAEGFNKLQNFNDAIATVYVTENGKNYGIANVDENTTEVALNFDAKEMGSYTISLDVNGEFETVTLVDRFTGVETDMLVENEYSFIASADDNVNRFVIRLGNGQEPTANSQFVYQSGEELILSIEGSVQIVDMLGRVVYSNEHASGNNRIYVGEFNDATYVVRVINEEGVKVQKVVIY